MLEKSNIQLRRLWIVRPIAASITRRLAAPAYATGAISCFRRPLPSIWGGMPMHGKPSSRRHQCRE
ncbi:hypothetical protein AB395_00003049 [Sinorhizobium fredii CCBAU 45436]|nr:hypothetical protein AB395_00003049 [Sinorhizobium fredii CCBAU 45436]